MKLTTWFKLLSVLLVSISVISSATIEDNIKKVEDELLKKIRKDNRTFKWICKLKCNNEKKLRNILFGLRDAKKINISTKKVNGIIKKLLDHKEKHGKPELSLLGKFESWFYKT